MREYLALAPVIALAACFDPPEPEGPLVDSHVEYYDLPGTLTQDMDILFVVDNTAGMAAHAAKVRALATYVDATLTWPDGTLPNARIAVTTSENGTGALRQPTVTTDAYLETGLDARFERTTNFEGSLADALIPLLDVGSSSTGSVRPLQAMQYALDAFLDPARYAYLAVITIAASDDASPAMAAQFAQAVRGRKTDPANVLVSGIYPTAAPRLTEFHDAFPNRSWTVNINADDYSGAVVVLSQLVRTTLGGSCVLTPADVDPETLGRQYDCALAAIYSDDTTEVLPQCSADGPARCFDIVVDLQNCQLDGYGRLVINGYPGYHRPRVRGQCVVN